MKKNLLGLTLALIMLAALADQTQAIPAFARRYNISCSTCHAPIPKLKPYGAEFAGDGFIMKENEKERDYVTAGDPLLWLNKTIPIAVRFDAYAVSYATEAKTDLQSPWGLKLLSGGALYKNIGYYFYFFMSERGEVAGIEDAYVHFNNIGGSEFDIMVGQFQTSDPLMKRELRLTFEDYQLYKYKAGLSNIDLTYDRGVMFLYGISKTGTDLIMSVTNGNGKGPADSDTKKFDTDNYKNIGFRVAQGIGENVTIGGFYYTGKERLASTDNTVRYVGPDFNLVLGKLELTAQYLERTDSNPFMLEQQKELKTKAAVVEAIFAPQLDRSRFYFSALYNDITQEKKLYQTFTLAGTYLLSRNLRGSLELTRDLIKDQNRIVLGIVTGF